MGGNSGDGGAAKRQREIESQKAAARRALNQRFGISGDRPDLDNYARPTGYWERKPGHGEDANTTVRVTQTGYDSERYKNDLANWKQAEINKKARENLYSGVRDSAFTAGKRGLDENFDKASRQNKFALFAQGLNVGSEDIDQNALLDRTYDRGLLDLGAKADAAKAEFKSGDEATRLQLLQSIDAGMDQSSAISSAINSLRNNADRATADANTTALDDLFSTSGALYTQSQAAKGRLAAQDWWNQFGGSGGSRAGRQNVSGIVTPAN